MEIEKKKKREREREIFSFDGQIMNWRFASSPFCKITPPPPFPSSSPSSGNIPTFFQQILPETCAPKENNNKREREREKIPKSS